MRLHFVGIGGIGMSGIAEVFRLQGYEVSGSDLSESDTTRRLRSLGIAIAIGHQGAHVHGAQVVVVSSAVPGHNPEVIEAKALRIPVIARAEVLGELMRRKLGVAIAGTHGKTTTTSMIAQIVTQAGLDPTIVIGGKVDALGGNARVGDGALVIAEADESDGSFRHLPATFSVITNIDDDHLDHFGGQSALDQAFVSFANQVPFYGCVIACGDDAGVRRVIDEFGKPYELYGIVRAEAKDTSDYAWQASEVRMEGFGSRSRITSRKQGALGELVLSVPGEHNVLNALAALAVADRLEIPPARAIEILGEFRGVRRRFELKHASQHGRVIDDYAHHPTEIRATLRAARAAWPGRVIAVFQPHRYSRTRQCWNDYLQAFCDADGLWLSDLYPAGEAPIAGVDSRHLAEAIEGALRPSDRLRFARAFGPLEAGVGPIADTMGADDLVICMGAGSITRLSQLIADRLEARSRRE